MKPISQSLRRKILKALKLKNIVWKNVSLKKIGRETFAWYADSEGGILVYVQKNVSKGPKKKA